MFPHLLLWNKKKSNTCSSSRKRTFKASPRFIGSQWQSSLIIHHDPISSDGVVTSQRHLLSRVTVSKTTQKWRGMSWVILHINNSLLVFCKRIHWYLTFFLWLRAAESQRRSEESCRVPRSQQSFKEPRGNQGTVRLAPSGWWDKSFFHGGKTVESLC